MGSKGDRMKVKPTVATYNVVYEGYIHYSDWADVYHDRNLFRSEGKCRQRQKLLYLWKSSSTQVKQCKIAQEEFS